MFDWLKKARPNDTRFDYLERMAIPYVGEDILLQSRSDRRDCYDESVARGLSQDDAWLQATGSYYLQLVASIDETQHAAEMMAVRRPVWALVEALDNGVHRISERAREAFRARAGDAMLLVQADPSSI